MSNWRKLALLMGIMMLLLGGLVACDEWDDEEDEDWGDNALSLLLDDEEWDDGGWDDEEWDDEDYCFPGELYDPETDECYIECDTEEECLELEEAIYGAIDEFWSGGWSNTAFGDTDDMPSLAIYELDNNLNITLIGGDEVDVDITYFDPAWHTEIWEFTRRLLPNDILRAEVAQFVIFTDGVEETLAYVSPLDDNPDKWIFAVDIADVEAAGTLSNPELVHTLVHELAHIITLENDQVPPDYEAVALMQAGSDEISDTEYYCETYYPGEGCSLPHAYINVFFSRFWADIHDELPEDPDDYDALDAFYERYADQFVTDYAATNPGEDIAESFTFFVLRDRPEEPTIAADKVRFFYDYPELVQVRQTIRAALARLQAENQ